MKEVVLVTLSLDLKTGKVDADAPFVMNSGRLGRSTSAVPDEPHVIE